MINHAVHIVFFCLCLFLSTASQAEEWKLVNDADSIKVYQQTGVKKDGIKKAKAITASNCQMETIIKVLKDVKSYPSWIPNCKDAKLLSQSSDSAASYVTTIDFPVFMDDRLTVVDTKLSSSQGGNSVKSESKASKQKYNLPAETIRITSYHSIWTFEKQDNRINISYQISVDPGGNVPKWLVNYASQKSIFQMIVSFKKQLKTVEK